MSSRRTIFGTILKMIKNNSIFYALILLFWSWAALAAAPLVASPDKPEVSVRLPANPSTGYQWVLVKYDAALMDQPSSHYVPSRSGLPGAAGYTQWQFKMKQAAFSVTPKTTVILEYKRPWEKTAVKQQIIEIELSTQKR